MKKFAIVSTVAACLACLCVVSEEACTPSQIAAVPQDIATVICVLSTVSSDYQAHDKWEVCVSDSVAKCNVLAATVEAIWAAHQSAEIKEGFNPVMPPIAADGGVAK